MKSISAKFLIGWGLSLGAMVSCEVGMLCAGYLGANSGQLLLFLRFAAALAALFLFAASVAFFRERMRPWVISIGLCVCMIEIADFAVLRGQRSTFFLGIKSRLKATLDPDAVQAWAVPLIEKSDPSSVIYIPPKDIPPNVRVPGWRLIGATIQNFGVRHMDIAWGSGMAGTYGLSIGPPEYVSHDVPWKPGVYIYRSK